MLPKNRSTMSFPTQLAMTPVVSLDSQPQYQSSPMYYHQHIYPVSPVVSLDSQSQVNHHLQSYPSHPTQSQANYHFQAYQSHPAQSQANHHLQAYPSNPAVGSVPAVSLASQMNQPSHNSQVSSFTPTPLQGPPFTSTSSQAPPFSPMSSQAPPSPMYSQASSHVQTSHSTSMQASSSTSTPIMQSSLSTNPHQGGFIYVRNHKRNARRRDHSISSSSSGDTVVSKSSKKKKHSVLQQDSVAVSNKFSALRNLNNDDDMISDVDNSNSKEKIPPLFVSKNSVQELREFIANLKTISADFTIKDTKEFLKLQCDTIDAYRKFSSFLNNKDIEYHSFRLPSDKTIDVVIKNVPISFNEDEISSELEVIGYKDFKLMRIWNKEKKPIPVINMYLDKKTSEK